MGSPALIETVTVPDFFSPSRLSGATGCCFRAASRSLKGLPSGPSSVLGTALHTVLEEAQMGRIRGEGRPRDLVAKRFAEVLKEAESAGEPHFVPIKDAFTPLMWRKKIGGMLRKAAEMVRECPPSSETFAIGDHWNGKFRDLDNRVASEVWISSEFSRIRGKIDWVEHRPGKVHIRDFKTGSVTNFEGNVHEHIVRQLRFYGLAALDLKPDCDVRLTVTKSRDWDILFGPDEIAEARAELKLILETLPPGAAIHAQTSASPGEACKLCAVRHQCSAYREKAPTLWGNPQDAPLPSDIWGVVGEVEERNGIRDIRLKDAADRWVRVFSLSDRHPSIKVGDAVWFFGLSWIRAESRRGELYRHPQNFHELPSSSGDRRAWGLKVFVDES